MFLLLGLGAAPAADPTAGRYVLRVHRTFDSDLAVGIFGLEQQGNKWTTRLIARGASSTSSMTATACTGFTIMNQTMAFTLLLKPRPFWLFVLSFEQIETIIGGPLPRAAQRASWWDSLRSPHEKMPQREACLAAGYIATRMPGATSVRFRRRK